MTRKEAREAVFGLLFETDFRPDEPYADIYAESCADREIPDDEYIRAAYFGVTENLKRIDEIIGKYSEGWKVSRLSPVNRTAIRLSIWEMTIYGEVPYRVSINEALEIVKKYGDPSSKAFVNGVLNAVSKNEM